MIGTVAVLFAATSCQKDESFAAQTNGTKIVWNSEGTIGDFIPSDDVVKATVESVVRVKWQSGDKVYVYDTSGKLGELSVTSKDNGRTARLEGTINTPVTDSITLVYSNAGEPTFYDLGDSITVNIAEQNQKDFPFVLYAASGKTPADVDFSFATAVMRVNGTGVFKERIDTAKIEKVNTVCKLTVKTNGAPDNVTGTTPGIIARSGNQSFNLSGDGRATFYIGMVNNASGSDRKIRLQGGTSFCGANFTNSAIKAGGSYNSVYAFSPEK